MYREQKRVFMGRESMDGAGVRIRRVFGSMESGDLDPFLLLDDFGSDHPDDYIAGFPWHPHRGIETVTWMLAGQMRHGDSIGNLGTIGPGEMQWMSAGSGIIHQEMPEVAEGRLRGIQLWVNIPAIHKMSPPRYRGVTSNEIPRVALKGGGEVLVLAGSFEGVEGPIRNVMSQTRYLDVRMPLYSSFEWPNLQGLTVFAYVLEGSAIFSPMASEEVNMGSAVLFEDGPAVLVQTPQQEARFILVAGKALNEPIAWRGPIVMNTQEELEEAFRQVRIGTFTKL